MVISDAVRTRETWDVAQAEYGEAPKIRVERKLYHAERRDLMDLAREAPDEIEAAMIIGHNPAFAEFSAQYAGSGERDALARLSLGFPPGGLAIFDVDIEQWRKLRWGAGELTRFLA